MLMQLLSLAAEARSSSPTPGFKEPPAAAPPPPPPGSGRAHSLHNEIKQPQVGRLGEGAPRRGGRVGGVEPYEHPRRL